MCRGSRISWPLTRTTPHLNGLHLHLLGYKTVLVIMVFITSIMYKTVSTLSEFMTRPRANLETKRLREPCSTLAGNVNETNVNKEKILHVAQTHVSL